ncbi:MAG: hypothetical protein ACR2KX_05870 [Chitinophagaceae bacterium]
MEWREKLLHKKYDIHNTAKTGLLRATWKEPYKIDPDNLYSHFNDITLNGFHGSTYEKPTIGFVFLLSCLALIGFPFTPTFLGIDILFTHIHKDQPVLIAATSLSFIFIEIAVLRIYARMFLGPNKKNDHPIAYRSS